jgi:hypothetical protein
VGYTDGQDGWNRAAKWDAGTYGDISGGHDRNSGASAINNRGEIVGWDNNRAAYFDPFPSDMGAPGSRSTATSISDSGFVAGMTFNIPQSWDAWVYDGSVFVTVATGPPGTTYANDVNNLGQVVGKANGEAFLWDGGNYYSLISLVDEGAGTLIEARSISDCGVIAGNAAEGAFLMVPIDATDVTDTDGDGLLDRWERCGVDIDLDGVADFVPPDADPLHADLYVELDHVAAAPVRPEVPAALVDAFAQVPDSDLPAPNPDGEPGITLHLLIDDGNVTEAGDQSLGSGPYNFPIVYDLMKEDFFGTAAERGDPDSEQILEAKRQIYHYGIMVQGLTATHAGGAVDYVSGVAECWGNDFMIGTRAFRFPPGSWQEQAGTLMHELGHNLALQHGGGDDMNFKANYFSVMNYTWQIPHPGMSLDWRLDYSRSNTNPTVFETILEEPLGLEGITRDGQSVPVYIALDGDTNRVTLAWTSLPNVDFDGDGSIDVGYVNADINHIDPHTPASPHGQHADFDDWESINLDFRASPSFPEGAHPACPGSGTLELSASLIQRLAEVPPPGDPAGIGEGDPGQAGAGTGAGAGAGAPEVGPNPFRDVTRLRFTLAEAGPVGVSVFDVSGRLVRKLFDGARAVGPIEVEWDGRDDRGRKVGNGLYFARVEDGRGRRTARVIVRR